ncbi:sulfide/dihydroorotate dehydrogenase-like FAD/NAD-binding protein [Alkaliphilus serpentinus]|uniref:Sulfide/dihydroorotate dehydrogenase-like FAD/NAD-binding protein n=1 Tax=Alkaliphilus serpentinus TaxID=1482731 RepID=A0A833HMA6_9FIRM|nr:sulfide/dihydroorotate dehydrogenase-like FAD/NAD-binding protein [Alkaliphilus serpentinus]KAB3527358.1 sulfide/dihydroorotate dehydrogenase-like FAD/NAD-binding protein [Alkaliphilus serpentinus]
MTLEGNGCIDAGSEYCPCYLAELNSCITCARLQGKDYCDCNWCGVCIYQNYHFLNLKKRELRQYQEVKIVNKEWLGEKLIIFSLEVPKGLARQLKQPGSYIFIRNKKYEKFFDIPISIMWVDEGSSQIKIAVEIHGVKTKALEEVDDSLMIRGPYWNGLFGIQDLKASKKERVLVVARGIAQAPAILAIKYLMSKENEIDVMIDKGTSAVNLIKEFFDVNILDENVSLYSDEGKAKLANALTNNKYDLLFIGGSDYLQDKLKGVYTKFKDRMRLVSTNNNEICCGEGICGSCTVYDLNGIPIRSCKTQITQKD